MRTREGRAPDASLSVVRLLSMIAGKAAVLAERSAAPRRRPRSMVQRRPAVAVLCAALLAGACGAAQPAQPSPATSPSGAIAATVAPHTGSTAPPSPSAVPATEALPSDRPRADVTAGTCAQVERPPLQSGSHLIGDQAPPVPYSSQPPTSGWHSSGHFDVAVRAPDDQLSEPDQVSVLEAGGVVVAYRKLPDDAIGALGDHVRDTMDGRVAVTPYHQLDAGQVAFTGWGVLQRCDGLDLDALDRFVRRFGTDERIEPGH